MWKLHGMLETVDRTGDGAAGGLGAALRAYCSAEMFSGADLVAEITGFDREIRDADVLVTGEGRSDEQTAHGKLCAVLAAKARAAGAKTILISGTLKDDLGEANELFDATFAAVRDACSLEKALAHGRENLASVGRSVGRALAMGGVFRSGRRVVATGSR